MEANETQKSKFVYPDKLYARTNDNITLDISYAPQTMEAVEYVRTDVFIERVCDWLSDTLQTVVDVNIPSKHHVESIPVLGIITQTEFIEKFKKEIEYLLD